MSNTKTQFKWFSIPEYDKEQEYLRQMHKSGWKLVRIGFPGVYHFEACQPEDVVYQLDYNPEGTENKTEYVQMFTDCGWEFLFDFVGYSYFRKAVKDMNGEEEIFCDDASRLDMMKRVFRGRIVPLILIFIGIVWQLILQSMDFYGDRDPVRVFLLALFGVTFVLYSILFVQFAVQFYAYKKRMKSR